MHVLVKGIVQGVGFRAWTRDRASALGLTGWVRNLQGGEVEAVFEGDREVVDQMVKALNDGPRASEVEKVEVQWGEYAGEFEQFGIA